jgi:hypothetical protein
MKFVKKSNGNVVITDNSNNIIKRIDASSYLQWMSSNTLEIQGATTITINTDDVVSTQVEPAAAVPFNGNAYDLMNTLTSDFFFKLNTGGSNQIEIQIAASDETTPLAIGPAKATFRLPFAMTLTEVRAGLTTAQSTGSILTVDINQNGSSVLGTKLTIDNAEKTSITADASATITTSALTDDAEITIDIDQVGDGTATGLKVTLKGTRA